MAVLHRNIACMCSVHFGNVCSLESTKLHTNLMSGIQIWNCIHTSAINIWWLAYLRNVMDDVGYWQKQERSL